MLLECSEELSDSKVLTCTMSRKRKVFLNPDVLCKESVIGCTVFPSRDDPELRNGVALTVLSAYDRN